MSTIVRWISSAMLVAVLVGCGSQAGSRAACPATEPNGHTPPGEQPSSLNHSNAEDTVWTVLWPEGEVILQPGGPGDIEPDGSLSIKWPWWRGVRGALAIEGHRLDANAPPLRAWIPEGYGDEGFQPTALIFPTTGCWQVTGRVGDAELSFVTNVVQVD